MEHSAGRPAPYGRACVNCARAKCKCMLRGDSSSCERCFRLKKECTPSSTVRKKRQRPGNSQTARLEEKLDGLVSLLKTNGRSNSPYYDSAAANLPCGWDAPGASRNRNVAAQAAAEASTCSSLCDSATTTGKTASTFSPLTPASASSTAFPYSLPHEAEVSDRDAEHYLHLFRTQHLCNFPFYYLPETKSSAEMRQEKPFFWLSIMSVTSTNLTQQLSLARVVRELASKEIIMEGERTPDLLLGLMCVVAWGHYQVQLGPLLTVFCHLLLALTSDLELQRMPQKDPSKHPRCPPPNVHYKFQIPSTRTLEHRRTILAVYLLTSSLSACHQRIDYLPWSPYLDDCLKHLDEINEAPNDKLLVYLTKIQLVTDQSVQTYSRIRDMDTEESTRFVVQHIFSLRQQLKLVREQIPSSLVPNRAIDLASYYSQIAINELILLRLQHATLAQEANSQAMDALLECAKSVKYYMESFISSFEPVDYIGMSFNVWKQMSSSMFLIARLVGLEDPGWDPNTIRSIVYLPDIIDGFASKVGTLVDMVGWKSGGAENVYMRSTKMLSLTRNWARSIYTNAEQQSGLDQEARQDPASLALVWQEEERRRWQQQREEQTQQTAMVAEAAEEEAMATAQMAGEPMLPAFDQDMWSDDMFGLWDIYSGRGAFAFAE